MACKDRDGLKVGLLWRRVYEVAGGGWTRRGEAWSSSVFAYNISLACNHCEKPICAEVCPTRAITRRADGIVLLDPAKCVGCKYCSWACPYGAPQYDDEAGTMSKCTFCAEDLNVRSGYEMRQAARQWIALGAIVLLCIQLLVTLLWVMGISATPGAALQAATRVSHIHGMIFRMRLALMVAAVVAASAALARWGAEVTADMAINLAFGLVLIAEVLGRMLFYEARVRHGV
jgi:DMSO reductase iron-sulfur subunit